MPPQSLSKCRGAGPRPSETRRLLRPPSALTEERPPRRSGNRERTSRRAFLLADPETPLAVARANTDLVLAVPKAGPDPIVSVVVLEVAGRPVVYRTPEIRAASEMFVRPLEVRECQHISWLHSEDRNSSQVLVGETLPEERAEELRPREQLPLHMSDGCFPKSLLLNMLHMIWKLT